MSTADPALAKKHEELKALQAEHTALSQQSVKIQDEIRRIKEGKDMLISVENGEQKMKAKTNELVINLENKKSEFLELKKQLNEHSYYQKLSEAHKKGGAEQVQ